MTKGEILVEMARRIDRNHFTGQDFADILAETAMTVVEEAMQQRDDKLIEQYGGWALWG